MMSSHVPRCHSLLAGCILAVCVVLSNACTSDTSSPSACLDPLPRDCNPAYDPTFEQLFSRRISITCGTAGTTCHASAQAAGARDGLILSQADQAYDLLLGNTGGKAYVVPGNPECSLVMKRLESTDVSFQMPPGMRLSDAELCAFTQWIANGAQR